MKNKPLWIVVEPLLFAHSIGYFQAILRNEALREKYDILFVYADEGTPDENTLAVLQEEYGDQFNSLRLGVSKRAVGNGFIRQSIRACEILRFVKQLATEREAELISFLCLDSIVRLMGIPFVRWPFRQLEGKISGVFFNSRCFRESELQHKVLSKLITRSLRTGFFQKVLFLDHGVIDLVQNKVGPKAETELGCAVDPWSAVVPREKSPRRESQEKVTLLTFGAHSRRKGTIQLLRMFQELPEETQQYRLLVVGPIRPDIREEFDQLISKIDPSLAEIEVVEGFVSDKDSWQYFHRSDIVVCPYLDFHGSSNVLIRAAAIGVPVVVPPFGFLQEVAREHKIGAVYESLQSSAILEAIKEVVSQKLRDEEYYSKNGEEYAEFHQELKYAPSFFSELSD